MPRTRRAFWEPKLLGNKARDKRVQRDLRRLGWSVLVVWECQTRSVRREWLLKRLTAFLKHRKARQR
jgi:DNA mismatch endonuclease (patch repair protein)